MEVDKQQLPLARRKWFKLRPELKNFWNFKMGHWTNGNKMDTNFKNFSTKSEFCKIRIRKTLFEVTVKLAQDGTAPKSMRDYSNFDIYKECQNCFKFFFQLYDNYYVQELLPNGGN